MELRLKPCEYNRYPLNGILVRGTSVRTWLLEIQRMQLDPDTLMIYPLPGTRANTVWGCLLIPGNTNLPVDTGPHERCQQVSESLFIAQGSLLFPAMTMAETEALFSGAVWFMHPDTGLAELKEQLDLSALVRLPEACPVRIIRPDKAPFIPDKIRRFQLAPVDVEEAVRKLETHFPKPEIMPDKSLNLFEKAKLAFYRLQFRKKNTTGKRNRVERTEDPTGFGHFMSMIARPFRKEKQDAYHDRVKRDLDDLERRNQKELDKLLDMLQKDPKEALKYAIPLDHNGSARGRGNGQLKLSRNWSVLSAFAQRNRVSSNRGGASVDVGDYFHSLQQQYRQTAAELVRQKEYEQAAFVYMKLLKDNHTAAQTLADGKLYRDAASIYLKHLNNKEKAAECFVNANLISNAIELYRELHNSEKVGDMFTLLHRKEEADVYYEEVAGLYTNTGQFLKAATIYREKMKRYTSARQTLREGWQSEGKEATDCLRTYLLEFDEADELSKELDHFYAEELTHSNREKFLEVLKTKQIREKQPDQVRDMAYHIISDCIRENPEIVRELRHFSPENKGLIKDVFRFKTGQVPKKNSLR